MLNFQSVREKREDVRDEVNKMKKDKILGMEGISM